MTTWETFFRDGIPTKDRFEKVHGACVYSAITHPTEQTRVEAHLFMGAPGSGKSGLKGLLTEEVVARSLLIDPDEFKAMLPENTEHGAEYVHEESSWLAETARAIAIGRVAPLINDAVGANLHKHANLVRRLRQNEYDVHLWCAHVPDVEELWRRVLYRGETTGRFVPEDFVREAHGRVLESFNVLRKHVTTTTLVDGRTGNIAWSSRGAPAVRDPNFLATLGPMGAELAQEDAT